MTSSTLTIIFRLRRRAPPVTPAVASAVVPMIFSILGACVFRVVWVYTVFAAYRTLPSLYISYPISWTLTGSAHFVCFLIVKRRLSKRIQLETA